ncbi:hypothetical protein ACFWVU_27840 [Streptomyces sp. NPDC058686]|uniref:hypothetical protein n=1 Tax=Streptomyces sp. NPDC058686 TaxID=3346599 RepID=UPI00364B0C6A
MAQRFKVGDRVLDTNHSRVGFIEQLPDSAAFRRLILRAVHGTETWPARMGALSPAPEPATTEATQ